MNFVLAAGGTGGHMVPAHALAAELKKRGHGVLLITDDRGARFPGLFDECAGAYPSGGTAAGESARLVRGGALDARRAAGSQGDLRDLPPGVGHRLRRLSRASCPARRDRDGIPTVVHEQNAVLGRVNRLLAREVAAIATAYPEVERLKSRYGEKTVFVGNPVREEVAGLREEPFPPFDEDGRSGSSSPAAARARRSCARSCPKALACFRRRFRHRLQVTQQCRPEDIDEVRARYAKLGIPAELITYIEDMPAKLAEAHLVIARSGASTIAELTAAGRPAILIPYRRRRTTTRPPTRATWPKPAAPAMIHQPRSRRRCSPSRSRSWPRIRRRSSMPRPARFRSASPTRPATSPISSSALRMACTDGSRLRADPARAIGGSGERRPRMKARTSIGRLQNEGFGHRHRHDPLRRHRRHRHVRHRRGDAQARLQGAGLRRCRGLCRRGAAQARHPGDDRPEGRESWRCRRRRHLHRGQARQSRSRGRASSAACPSSAAPRCWPS